MIVGFEWAILAAFGFAILVCLYLIFSVQGDLIDDTKRGVNSDEEAERMFLSLVAETRREIVIHDDGDDTDVSIYNNDQVLVALRERIREHDIQIRCLFNDEEPGLKLLRLAREHPENVHVWYMKGARPDHDTHYKIVDGGRLVHLSQHAHGESERMYVLRKPPAFATKGSRRRISQSYMDTFNHGLKAATPVRV